MKTALLIGATGLVGDYLLRQLLSDDRFDKIRVFTRRPTGYSNPSKLEEYVVDFDQPTHWHDQLRGDVLFSSLGTTLKQAGSQAAQYKIDYTYQYETAAAAAHNGVPTYVLVSAPGANPDAFVFYSRMKGELERAVEKLAFQHIRILQPGVLAGFRTAPRLSEQIAVVVASALSALPGLGKYRPIHGRTVAQAMRAAALDETPGIRISTLGQLFEQAEK